MTIKRPSLIIPIIPAYSRLIPQKTKKAATGTSPADCSLYEDLCVYFSVPAWACSIICLSAEM